MSFVFPSLNSKLGERKLNDASFPTGSLGHGRLLHSCLHIVDIHGSKFCFYKEHQTL